jgi:hypothetical protein
VWKNGEGACNLFSIGGLKFPVATDGKRVQIGCKNFTVEKWEELFKDKIPVRFAIRDRDFLEMLPYAQVIRDLVEARKNKEMEG